MDQNYTMRERMSGAINALSISPEGNSVVVAGRESKRKRTRVNKVLYKQCILTSFTYTVLKVLSINKPEITETLNLRAGSHFNLNYSSNDVKWGNNGN
jgi:hypothetical protein